METNITTLTIYNFPDVAAPEEEQVEKIAIWELPKILWAGVILFIVNVLVATGIVASPDLNVGIYGEPVESVVAPNSKPTAFVSPEPQKPRAVRAAIKLQPIFETSPVSSMELDIPRASVQPASYVSGDKAYKAAEKLSDFPRVTAPVTGPVDVAPRKVSPREVRSVVIN